MAETSLDRCDILVIGGGIGGSSLARTMASAGLKVVVIEKEREFRDRVRGEAMSPWGVPKAQKLGIFELLIGTCGHALPWVDSYVGPALIEHRNLPETTTCGTAELAFSHPVMQEIVLQAARDAGATVLRGAALRELLVEPAPRAVIELDGRSQTIHAG